MSICIQRVSLTRQLRQFLEYIMSDEYGKKMESLGYGVSSKMQVKEH